MVGSPKPWSVSASEPLRVNDSEGSSVCRAHLPGLRGDIHVAKTNAADIVRAVNAHEALVEAGEELLADKGPEFLRSKSWDKLRAALSLAKGDE